MLVLSCPPTCLTQFTRTDNKVFRISAVKPKVKGPRVYHEIKAVIPSLQGDASSQLPPDLPSYIFKERIVYLGMTLVPSVTELILAELLYLQYENNIKPIHLYINSTGTSKVFLVFSYQNIEVFVIRRVKNMGTIPKHLQFMIQFNMSNPLYTPLLLVQLGVKLQCCSQLVKRVTGLHFHLLA